MKMNTVEQVENNSLPNKKKKMAPQKVAILTIL